MYKAITLILLVVSLASFSQQTRPQTLSIKEDYLKKSRNKKTTGWVMLATGVSMMAAGIPLMNSGDNSLSNLGAQLGGLALTIGGFGFGIGSALFFSSSQKYKQKAAVVGFKIENAPRICSYGFAQSRFPVLKLSVPL